MFDWLPWRGADDTDERPPKPDDAGEWSMIGKRFVVCHVELEYLNGDIETADAYQPKTWYYEHPLSTLHDDIIEYKDGHIVFREKPRFIVDMLDKRLETTRKKRRVPTDVLARNPIVSLNRIERYRIRYPTCYEWSQSDGEWIETAPDIQDVEYSLVDVDNDPLPYDEYRLERFGHETYPID